LLILSARNARRTARAVDVFLFQARTSQLAFIVLNTANWGSGRLPMDWQIKMTHGRPDISVCKETETCLHLKSVKSSFALEHSVDVDPAQMPFLTWNWKVAQLPAGGDFRHASSDDDSGEPDLPARINALDCPEPDEAILEKPVTLRCAVSPKLPIASVMLHYRTPGKDAYDETEMTKVRELHARWASGPGRKPGTSGGRPAARKTRG
jgi:hypothetical protein